MGEDQDGERVQKSQTASRRFHSGSTIGHGTCALPLLLGPPGNRINAPESITITTCVDVALSVSRSPFYSYPDVAFQMHAESSQGSNVLFHDSKSTIICGVPQRTPGKRTATSTKAKGLGLVRDDSSVAVVPVFWVAWNCLSLTREKS